MRGDQWRGIALDRTFSFSSSVVLPALSRPRMSSRSSSLRTKYSHRPYSRENMWPLPAMLVAVGAHGGVHGCCTTAVKSPSVD